MKLHLVVIALSTATVAFAAAPTEVNIHDDKPFPESITSTSDGSLIIGGLGACGMPCSRRVAGSRHCAR
jgi:hypothetical protein